MFTEAQEIAAHRDRAENMVSYYIDPEYPDEVVTLAVDLALDETDATQESDGTWNDCTPYQDCARRAIEIWESDRREMHEMALDDMTHAAADRMAGF